VRADVTIRELEQSDVPFLREMLCAAIFWRPRRRWRPRVPRRLVLLHPEAALYHRDWGRPGDAGFVAEADGRRIGAVWYRFFTEEKHGDGYLDPDTPELAIAVADGHRGCGVGRRLMEAIHERARRDCLGRIALSVDDANPARRLYAALGYEEYEPGDGKGRMVLELAAPEASRQPSHRARSRPPHS
jgi:GNAT superfamily N-acetyltransferase